MLEIVPTPRICCQYVQHATVGQRGRTFDMSGSFQLAGNCPLDEGLGLVAKEHITAKLDFFAIPTR